MQLAIDFTAPRAEGERLGNLSTDKAERVADFDSVGAGKFIHSLVVRHGPTSGEDLVEAAQAHGFRAHDRRAFGPIFAKLLRDQRLMVLRSDLPRKHGHGTSGGRLYGAVR